MYLGSVRVSLCAVILEMLTVEILCLSGGFQEIVFDSGVEFRGEDKTRGKQLRITCVSIIFQVTALEE